MAKDGDESLNHNSLLYEDSESNKSFVKKVKSRVSSFLPSTFSNWFGKNEAQRAVVRQREDVEDEDEETFQIQPPLKRARPSDNSYDTNFISTPVYTSQNRTLHRYPNNAHKVFQEPMPGPSGVKSRKLLIPNHYRHNGPVDLLNGDKDSDSGESTSGYSSMPRIGSKEQVSEITDKHSASTNKPANNRSLFNSTMAQERSLFNDRTSPFINSSLSSRRPSFNASIGSPNFMDRTLSTKRIVDSPFYGGRTTYGGASAYSRHLINKSPEKLTSLRNFVQAKPVHDDANVNNVTLSKTAKRILNTLEQYTSPVQDVKRIPNPKRQKCDGLISKYTSSNPYVIRDKVASNRELNVPTVSDLLKLKLKERLQDSTVSVRSIATNSNSPLNVEEYKLRNHEEDNSKNTFKMKTKVAAVRQRLEPDDTVAEVKLPEIKLPISTLPSFDFTIPSPFEPKVKDNPKITETPKQTFIQKPITTITTNMTELKDYKTTEYKFSNPLIISENSKSIKAINNFKFSEPVNKKPDSQASPTNTFDITSDLLKKLKPTSKSETNIKASKNLLKTGSDMDIRKSDLMDKFKPAKNTWECEVCMIRNADDKTKCVACETSRSNKSAPVSETPKKIPGFSAGFGNQFKIASNQWECGVCMIRNDADKTKCAACETPCPPKGGATASFLSTSNFGSGFGNAFKMSTDKWECEACMVRNEVSVSNCVACTTPKVPKVETYATPKPLPLPIIGFGEKFKASASSWECSQCFVRNTNADSVCVACDFAKPGSKAEADAKEALKQRKSEWECETCMVRNSENSTKCVCCESVKPGSIVSNSTTIGLAVTSNVPKFSFGIDKGLVNSHGFTFGIQAGTKTANLDKVDAGSIFGAAAKNVEASIPATGFMFGVNGAKTEVSKPIEAIKPTLNSTPITTPVATTNDVKKTVDVPEADVVPSKKQADDSSAFFTVDSNKTISFNGDISKENGALQKTKPVIQFGLSNKGSSSTIAESKPATPSTNLFSFNTTTPPTNKPELKVPEAAPVFKFNTESKPVAPASPMFGTPKTNSTVFGQKEATPTSSSTAPTFGIPTTTFGAPASKENQFAAKIAAPAATPVFSFGAAKPAPEIKSTPSSTMFNAGSAAPSGGGFSFVPPAPVAESSTSSGGGFNFTAPKNDAPPAFGASAFAAPSAPTFGAPTSNIFGSGSAQPVQNGNFTFGSSAANAPKEPGFGFSAAATAPASGFNFGSNAALNPPPQSGGFNFGGASTITPNFNADAKPTFNFTASSAPNMFSAQLTGDQPQKSGRVIRRAHRRTQR